MDSFSLLEDIRDTQQKQLVEMSEMTVSKLNELKLFIQKEFTEKQADLLKQVEALKSENEGLYVINSKLQKARDTLETKISHLEEEHRSFTKVSNMIMIQNENTRLKKQVADLTAEMQKSKTKVVCERSTMETQTILAIKKDDRSTQTTPIEEPIQPEQEREEQNDLQVKEKKIGKTIFYIDQDNNVYTKQEDGAVGEKVGELKKELQVDGKTKTRVIWI